MLNIAEAHSQLQSFSEAFQYDAGYLTELLDAAPGAYEAFVAGQTMSSYRKALPLDAHYVARIATMQAEDCGPCAQLNLRMAVADGVDRELLATLIDRPDPLPSHLCDIVEHCRAVVTGALADPDRAQRIRAHYGAEAFAELAVCIAGCRIYPTTKRALLKAGVCERLSLDFAQ